MLIFVDYDKDKKSSDSSTDSDSAIPPIVRQLYAEANDGKNIEDGHQEAEQARLEESFGAAGIESKEKLKVANAAKQAGSEK